MIHLRNKKWGWPLFRFCVDISINNAYQLYQLQPHNQGQKQLDLLGFRREIVEVYYKRFQSEKNYTSYTSNITKHTKSSNRYSLR
uniref:PiggyBac transposable elementderived protein 3like [Latimeria chalumnae] n=1 Tax=Lepeophtheirus salmonis TaxID=72036 RepID=A0A0K2TB89_LEPSM